MNMRKLQNKQKWLVRLALGFIVLAIAAFDVNDLARSILFIAFVANYILTIMIIEFHVASEQNMHDEMLKYQSKIKTLERNIKSLDCGLIALSLRKCEEKKSNEKVNEN